MSQKMSEVERSEYERVIEEQEHENSGLKQEVMEMRKVIQGMKEVQQRRMEANVRESSIYGGNSPGPFDA